MESKETLPREGKSVTSVYLRPLWRDWLLWLTLLGFFALMFLTSPLHAVPLVEYPPGLQERVDVWHKAKSVAIVSLSWFISYLTFTLLPTLLGWGRRERTAGSRRAFKGLLLSAVLPIGALAVMFMNRVPS